MAETQDELKTGIGNEEAITLKPINVKILSAKVEVVGEKKKAKKVICEVKHPDSPNPIHISSVKYVKKEQLKNDGLWFNLDSKGLIKKGSALAIFLNTLGAKSIEELKDKESPTVQDDNGYLTFKAY
jgi:hypothetical protein